MKNYEAEKLRKIIKAKEEAMVIQIKETDELRNELNRLKSSLLYSEDDLIDFAEFKASNLMKHSDKDGFYLGTKKVFEIWVKTNKQIKTK